MGRVVFYRGMLVLGFLYYSLDYIYGVMNFLGMGLVWVRGGLKELERLGFGKLYNIRFFRNLSFKFIFRFY